MNEYNICLMTDSYKLGHHNMQVNGVEIILSYFESRKGARFDTTVFFGLQRILKKYLVGHVVTREKIEEAALLSKVHMANDKIFNRAGWEYILSEFGGVLPVRIKAVREGSVVPVSNVLMTIENLGGPKTAFLVGHLEDLLTHVWYPSTVATLSRETKKIFKHYLDRTSDNPGGINFMLHDFGYRGVSSVESAGAGGNAHLVNFMGTDTIQAMIDAVNYYNASLEGLAYSVPATEHSIMTARGPDGECDVIGQLLEQYPTGILSVVCDSYDDERHVSKYLGEVHREAILARDGVFVVRPDSGDPEEVTIKLIDILGKKFGYTKNSKGYRVLNPKVRLLWGDGIDIDGIRGILGMLMVNGWSAENMVFGMGGGLLQKVNRDTQRFAFKCCAQKQNGAWVDIFKNPKEKSKASKRGRLALVKVGEEYKTISSLNLEDLIDQLEVVYENGLLLRDQNFSEIRENAKL